MFRKTGIQDIEVNILPYYLIAGVADPTSLQVWEMKMEILARISEKVAGSVQRAKELSDRFMEDLRNEEILCYNFLFLVQGKA
jgi:hypothetical protein